MGPWIESSTWPNPDTPPANVPTGTYYLPWLHASLVLAHAKSYVEPLAWNISHRGFTEHQPSSRPGGGFGVALAEENAERLLNSIVDVPVPHDCFVPRETFLRPLRLAHMASCAGRHACIVKMTTRMVSVWFQRQRRQDMRLNKKIEEEEETSHMRQPQKAELKPRVDLILPPPKQAGLGDHHCVILILAPMIAPNNSCSPQSPHAALPRHQQQHHHQHHHPPKLFSAHPSGDAALPQSHLTVLHILPPWPCGVCTLFSGKNRVGSSATPTPPSSGTCELGCPGHAVAD